MNAPGHAGTPGPREEQGSAAGSRLHPPHVVEGEPAGTAAEQQAKPKAEPAPPANGASRDHASTDEHPRRTDHASMYDRRPEEDKGHEPGDA
ncbi:MAG: hypothetical protein JWM27_1336 [Gemmatimonadetes bacterium]|nr:hypothetical protein [Gemmatimonadota bacterium]